jgi:plastocyanin
MMMLKLSSMVFLALSLVLWPESVSAQTYYLPTSMMIYAGPGVISISYPSQPVSGCCNPSQNYQPAITYMPMGQNSYNSPGKPINSNTVMIQNFQFNPQEIVVTKGATVTWINQDSAPHTTTADSNQSDSWDSGSLSTGQSYSRTFSTPGVYYYHCAIHPEMRGVVRVIDNTKMNSSSNPYPTSSPGNTYCCTYYYQKPSYYSEPKTYYQSNQDYYNSVMEYCKRLMNQVQSSFQYQSSAYTY